MLSLEDAAAEVASRARGMCAMLSIKGELAPCLKDDISEAVYE